MLLEATKWYLGRSLKDIREKKGLTQRELARLSGVGETTISQTELDFSQPTLGFMREIEKALGLPVGALYRQSYPESERLPQEPRPRGRPQKEPKDKPPREREKEAGP